MDFACLELALTAFQWETAILKCFFILLHIFLGAHSKWLQTICQQCFLTSAAFLHCIHWLIVYNDIPYSQFPLMCDYFHFQADFCRSLSSYVSNCFIYLLEECWKCIIAMENKSYSIHCACTGSVRFIKQISLLACGAHAPEVSYWRKIILAAGRPAVHTQFMLPHICVYENKF